MLEKMKRLVKDRDMCVLATVFQGKPHCSLMAYVSDDSGSEIYMATHRKTSKYRNLLMNPSVSLLIDTREDHPGPKRPEAKAMTVDGSFEKMENEEKKRQVKTSLLRRHPHLKAFLEDPDAEILCIKIRSYLLLDGLTEAHFEEV